MTVSIQYTYNAITLVKAITLTWLFKKVTFLRLIFKLLFRANILSAQTHHVYSRLKRRVNGRFHVASTWNTRCVFVGI